MPPATHAAATCAAATRTAATRAAAALGLVLAAGLPAAAGAESSPTPRRATSQIAHTSFDAGHELRTGARIDTLVSGGAVRLKHPTRTRTHEGKSYEVGIWTSAWVTEAFGFTELIPSWQASTPGRSWIELKVRLRSATGAVGSWDTMARWASGSRAIKRTTLGSQDDDLAAVAVDTLRAQEPDGAVGWQLKVQLMRPRGGTEEPSLQRIGAMASRVAPVGATSAPGPQVGTVLDVPAYSQMTHSGHYPGLGGGGEAWCSPTSLAMVLGFHGANPPAAAAYGGGAHPDAAVDYTASRVYDHGYDGTGNWAFNTAYAGTLVSRSYVTRLPDLRAAEPYLAAGTPLIVSVAFGVKQLTGAPISSTSGHLMVLVGFTATGDVVVNDPAASSNAGVRRTYSRAEFERVWQAGSGGLTYVVEK